MIVHCRSWNSLCKVKYHCLCRIVENLSLTLATVWPQPDPGDPIFDPREPPACELNSVLSMRWNKTGNQQSTQSHDKQSKVTAAWEASSQVWANTWSHMPECCCNTAVLLHCCTAGLHRTKVETNHTRDVNQYAVSTLGLAAWLASVPNYPW